MNQIKYFNLKLKNKKENYEDFQDKVKKSVFYLMHVLLQNQQGHLGIQIINIVIEMLQMIAFPFSIIFTASWKKAILFDQISYFFFYFHLIPFFFDSEFIFLIVFYLCVIIVLITVIGIAFFSFSLSKGNVYSIWVISTIKIIFELLSTSFFLPLLHILMSQFNCINKEDISREINIKEVSNVLQMRRLTVNYYIPSMTCYSSAHIIHMIFGGLFAIVFICVIIMITMTLFDSKLNNSSSTAKITCDFDMMFLIIKIILILLFIFYGKSSNEWILIVFLIIFCMILLYVYLSKNPYTNRLISSLYLFSIGLFTWACFILLLGKIFQATTFNGAIPLFFIGIPFLIFILASNQKDELGILLNGLNRFKNGLDALKQIRLLILLYDKKNYSRKALIMIKSYAYQYETTCELSVCPLKKYVESYEKGQEISAFLLQHIELLFISALSKFPACSSLRIAYCFFLLEYLNKKPQANIDLMSKDNQKMSYEEQFILFRYRKFIEEQSADIKEEDENIDIAANLTYKKCLNQFKVLMHKISTLYMDFWTILVQSNKEHDQLTKLNNLGTKINKATEEIHNLYTKIQKVNPNDREAMYYYSDFLNDILNDKDKSSSFKEKLNEVNENKQVADDINYFNLDTSALNVSDEYQYIIASGNTDSFGVITHISLGVCLLLGYSRNELVGKLYEIIVPEIYQIKHRQILLDKVNDYKKEITNMAQHSNYKPSFRSVKTFARSKARYLIPITLKVALLSTETQGIAFLAKFHPDSIKTTHSQNASCYVITNNMLIIQNFTVNAVNLLGINSNSMSNSSDITFSIKQFHEEFHKIAIDSEGLSPEQRLSIKRQIINNKFRNTVPIMWKNDNLFEQRPRNLKKHDSFITISWDNLKKSPNMNDNFFLSIQDAVIANKQEGYIFKFENINHSKAPTSSLIMQSNIGLSSQELFSLNKTSNNKLLSSLQNINNENYSDKLEMQFEKLKAFIPDSKTNFYLDPKKLAFVNNHKDYQNIKEELKNQAIAKIGFNQSNISSLDNSDEDDSFSSDSNSDEKNSSSNSKSNSNSNNNENDKSVIMKKTSTSNLKKKSVNINQLRKDTEDTYYKVIMTHIKYSIYSFEKGMIVEVPLNAYQKKSQVELKLTNDDKEEQNTNIKKTSADKDKGKEDEKFEVIDNEGIIIKQIEYALSKEDSQPTIIRLRWISFFLLFFYLAFEAGWMGIVIHSHTNLTESFHLVIDSYNISYNAIYTHALIRDLTLLPHLAYIPPKEKITRQKDIIKEMSELYYQSHTLLLHIMTTFLSLSEEQNKILYKDTIGLGIIKSDLNKVKYFMTLSSAFIEVNTAAYHIINELTEYLPSNHFIYFYLHNMNNELCMSLQTQIKIFLQLYNNTIDGLSTYFIIIMAIGYTFAIGTYFIFAFAYNGVARQKESYLSVFFEIGMNVIVNSIEKCERFTKKMQAGSFYEFLSTEGNDVDEPLLLQPSQIKMTSSQIKEKKSSSKNVTNSKETIIIKILYCSFIAIVILASLLDFYFISIFLQNLKGYITIYQSQHDINLDFALLYRDIREYLFDDESIVDLEIINNTFPKKIDTFYEKLLNNLNVLSIERSSFPPEYSKVYSKLYHNDVCTNASEIQMIKCMTLLYNSTTYGNNIVSSGFIEEIRILKQFNLVRQIDAKDRNYKYHLFFYGLKEYENDIPPNAPIEYFELSPINMFNRVPYMRISEMFDNYLKMGFDLMFETLYNCIDNYQLQQIITHLVIVSLFLLLTSSLFFFIWKPFEKNLNNIIFKTKNMLGIIPKEVLSNIPSIHKLLNIQQVVQKSDH